MPSINCDNPVFVIGTPRSGTTLTAKILGVHSNLFMPGETHFYDDIFSRRFQLGELPSAEVSSSIAERLYTIYGRYYEEPDQVRIEKIYTTTASLARDLVDVGSYPQAFSVFMESQMMCKGKVRWGNNAPRDIFSVEDIIEGFPNANLIICVRDVRAFLLSYKGKWKVTGEEHVARLKKLYHPIITTLLWKASIRKAKQISLSDKVSQLIVKYEDLVTNPKVVVENMCEEIGESFEPGMLDVETNNSSDRTMHTGIFATSVDSWKTELSSEEVVISQFIAREELQWLGYELISTKISWIKMACIVLATPVALWRALHANRNERGPLLPYLFKRLKAL